ncbi:hypothetical protein LINGRAHAP2_LOCUS30177 [Linum grandiflorum]
MYSRLIACTYLGPIHQSVTSSRRLANDFSKRDVMKMIVPHIDRFVKYGSRCPYRYILSLGWSSFLHYILNTFCRTAVQKFYYNLAVISVQPLQAQTVVDGRVILFNPGVISQLAVIPIEGIPYYSELEIRSQGFDFEATSAALCSSPLDRLTHFNISFLPEDLRVLHWFITRIFIPRSFAWDTVTPIDVWVLHNAFYGQPLSLPHLLFSALLDVGASFYPGSLPFAPQLTLLMHTAGIDLSDNILKHVVYHLNPQHTLCRVHCAAAPVNPPPVVGGKKNKSPVSSPFSDLIVVTMATDAMFMSSSVNLMVLSKLWKTKQATTLQSRLSVLELVVSWNEQKSNSVFSLKKRLSRLLANLKNVWTGASMKSTTLN